MSEVLVQLWPFVVVAGAVVIFAIVGLLTTITLTIEWALELWDLRQRRKDERKEPKPLTESTGRHAVVNVGGE